MKKYVLLHHNEVVMTADFPSEFARHHFKIQAFEREDGNIGIMMLGNVLPMSYVSIKNDPRPGRGWTLEEAESDYILCYFNPHTFNQHWANYAIYKLCD